MPTTYECSGGVYDGKTITHDRPLNEGDGIWLHYISNEDNRLHRILYTLTDGKLVSPLPASSELPASCSGS
jgi:hypothetical protein